MGFFSGVSHALSGAVSGVVGAAGSLIGAKADRDFQKSQQSHLDARDDTKYQRMVADLKKAGLNPALAYGGASPGTPQQASASNAYSQAGGKIADLMSASSAQDIQRQNLDVQRENIAADTDLKKQEAINKEIEATGKELDNVLKNVQADNEKLKGKLITAQTQHELRKIVQTDEATKNLTLEQQNKIIELASKKFDLELKKQDPRNRLENMIEEYRVEMEGKHLNHREKAEKIKIIRAELEKLVQEGKITKAEAESWENSLFMRNYKSVIGAIDDTVGVIGDGVKAATRTCGGR